MPMNRYNKNNINEKAQFLFGIEKRPMQSCITYFKLFKMTTIISQLCLSYC